MATEQIDLTKKFSPAQIAKALGVNVTKVLYWINTGELKAVNYATKQGGLPRWKITAQALADFERPRQSGPSKPATTTRRRKPAEPIEDFFPDS